MLVTYSYNMEAKFNVLRDISPEPYGSYWTLILTTKGSNQCLIKGNNLKSGKGIVIIPSGFNKDDISCSDDFEGSIIQIPSSLVTGSNTPVSSEFIRKVETSPYLDLSSEDKEEDLKMASNYWFLIKEALSEIDSIYARSEIISLCKALMKFCEKHYCKHITLS